MSVGNKLKTINKGLKTHPLTSNAAYKRKVIRRMLLWQMTKFRYGGGKEIEWINNCKLKVYPGRASATGNYYYGLLEYEPMSFAYHYINEEDVFFDIGANVGVYSVLAKAATKVIAFEPADDTRAVLQENFKINGIEGVVVPKGVSGKSGVMHFTQGNDCVNHIVTTGQTEDVISIEVVDLDSYVKESGVIPSIIKIDAEGAEGSIIEGAKDTFSDERLNVIIMEIFDDEKLSDMLVEKGFRLYRYEPKNRELTPGTVATAGGTGIYIRDVEVARQRVSKGAEIVYRGDSLASY